MAGILVEYSRFVEVQQRRARGVAQLMQSPEPFLDIIESSAIDDHPVDIGESLRQLRSVPDEAARHPDSTDAWIP
jgi:hypothetical protein